jgi:hypothetical protein
VEYKTNKLQNFSAIAGTMLIPNDYMLWQFLSHRDIHGRIAQFIEWDAHIYRVPHIMEDGVILVPSIFEYGSAFPVGLCECGNCGAFWITNHIDRMYWDYQNQMIICEDCLQEDVDIEPIAMVSIHVPVLQNDSSIHIRFTQIVDETLEHALAEGIAIQRGMHFFNGDTALDLFHLVLAKRTVRRWKAVVQRKLIRNLSLVFLTRLGIDPLTCIALAKRGGVQ